MCGILGIFGAKDTAALRPQALKMAATLRHRGPDWSGIYSDDSTILCHERLSIVDVEHGAQPLIDIKTKRVLAVNGEIYDHVQLSKLLKKKHDWQTKSDCEVLLYLYDEFGPDFLSKVDGIFAFCLYDPITKEYFIARDHIGIVPLYIGWDRDGTLYVASEMKAIEPYCKRVQEFPPGHYYQGKALKGTKDLVQWYKPKWMTIVPTTPVSLQKLREELEKSVKKQLMCDVPYGVLISGGLDSSIIASIIAKYARKRVESGDQEEAWWPRLHSFAIGLKDSPDLKFARQVAEHIGSVHHELIYTVQEGLDALRDVIYHIETYDVTSIRASTPMYLMARKIKSLGIKMVLSGEGADEVFGGYLYFHMAPSAQEFHEETVRKLQKLSKFDCLRANKSMAAWGVEARVPYLGKDFLDYAMGIDPKDKMCGQIIGEGEEEEVEGGRRQAKGLRPSSSQETCEEGRYQDASAASVSEVHCDRGLPLSKTAVFGTLRQRKAAGMSHLDSTAKSEPIAPRAAPAPPRPTTSKPQYKPEKYILRKAFEGYLPDQILWRQKEQFSDGVGYSWIDSLKAYAEEKISQEMFEKAAERFPIHTPTTKEAYLYRMIFEELFPSETAALTVEYGPSIACSTPTAYRWSKQFQGMADPSGRAVKVHQQAVTQNRS